MLARWDGAFDGLHSLMGYGAITFDTTEEGARVVKYAKQGTPLIDAWLRTGQELPRRRAADANPERRSEARETPAYQHGGVRTC